jgi:flagellar basal-body rod modification protein FlgD
MSGLWMPIPFDPETGPVENVQTQQPRGRRNTGELDRDAFLMLLITQMQHQDPLNPMDDRDFLAQMAQFSALEQQQIMTRSMELQQAYAMIGKTVYAQFFDETAEMFRDVAGPVMHVRRSGNNIFLGVHTNVPMLDNDGVQRRNDLGEPMYEARVIDTPVDRVNWVEDEHVMSWIMQGVLDGVANSRDIGIIGRYVQAITFDASGNPTGLIEGRVDHVRFVDGQTVLMVNGREIFNNEVLSVSNNAMVMGREIDYLMPDGVTTASARIRGIDVVNGRVFVNLDNNERLQVNDGLNRLMEGLQLVGTHVSHPDASIGFNGTVTAMSIRRGEVFIHIGNMRMGLNEFRETGGTASGTSPGNGNSSEDEDA